MAMVLEAEQVSKTYRGGDQAVHALREASLSAEKGEFVAIMGASGSGKSTLLHLIGGLDVPDGGEIRIEGESIVRMSDRRRTLFRRRRLGFIFQGFNLLPTLTARENIALPTLIDGRSGKAVTAKVDELLAMVDLSHRASHRPGALSGGEQQRVAVARALMNDPAIILADEPTGNLDSISAAKIWSLLRQLCREKNATVLMVTHEAAGGAYADRVLVLKDGRMVGQIDSDGSGDATLVATRYQKLAG